MADKTKGKTAANPTALEQHTVIPETKTAWWVLSADDVRLP